MITYPICSVQRFKNTLCPITPHHPVRSISYVIRILCACGEFKTQRATGFERLNAQREAVPAVPAVPAVKRFEINAYYLIIKRHRVAVAFFDTNGRSVSVWNYANILYMIYSIKRHKPTETVVCCVCFFYFIFEYTIFFSLNYKRRTLHWHNYANAICVYAPYKLYTTYTLYYIIVCS